MKALFCVCFIFSVAAGTIAQEKAAPAADQEPAKAAMQTWIANTDAPWQLAFKRDVTDVYETELGKMKRQYAAALEAGISKASSASDLDAALALRNEQKRFSETGKIPEEDEPAEAVPVKQIRAAFRTQLARLAKERSTRAGALWAKYDPILAQAQAQLTQAKRLDDALLVKNKREEVGTAWRGPRSAEPPAPAGEPVPPATASRIGAPTSPASRAPASGRDLTRKLAKTNWGYSPRDQDPAPTGSVTIYADDTLTFNDKPSDRIPFKALDALNIQVRDHIWRFTPDLQSFTVHNNKEAPATRFGTRINQPKK